MMMFKAIVRSVVAVFFVPYLRRKNVYVSYFSKYNMDTFFEGKNKIGGGTNISGSFIGRGTYIGRDCNLSTCKIGKYCSIGSNVKTVLPTHPTNVFVSTHPAFFSTKKQAGFTYVNNELFNETKTVNNRYGCIIGNDVWIGDDVTILGGVTIGDGAVIALGAVVTEDVEPYSIVGGIPAKMLHKRFDDRTIGFLLTVKWWNKEDKWLRAHVMDMSNIQVFIAKLKSKA